MLTVGTVLLVEPLIELTKGLLEAYILYTCLTGKIHVPGRGRPAQPRAPALKLALVAVVALSVYTSTQICDTSPDPDAASTVASSRRVVAVII